MNVFGEAWNAEPDKGQCAIFRGERLSGAGRGLEPAALGYGRPPRQRVGDGGFATCTHTDGLEGTFAEFNETKILLLGLPIGSWFGYCQ